MKKLFLRAEFGPLWGPWEVDETPRKFLAMWKSDFQMNHVEIVFLGFHPLPKAPRGVQILLSETGFSCVISFPYGL